MLSWLWLYSLTSHLVWHNYLVFSILLLSSSSHSHNARWVSASLTHYDDVIMTTIASQITSLTSVYSTVYSDADQTKHQSSASLAFVWGIHRDRWIPRTKGQFCGKCFHLMTSSWWLLTNSLFVGPAPLGIKTYIDTMTTRLRGTIC